MACLNRRLKPTRKQGGKDKDEELAVEVLSGEGDTENRGVARGLSVIAM